MLKKLLQSSGALLIFFFLFYVALSWILFFQDTRALLAISNFSPNLRAPLFATQTMLMHYKLNTIPTALFAFFAFGAFFFYFRSLKQKISLRITIIYSLIFGFVIFFSYPTLSTDIFSYIFSDRIATVYHQNVWEVVPLTHNFDPFAIMADWKNTTRVYGEVNQLLYTLPSIIGGNNLVLLVVLYKLVSSIFAAGIFWILFLLLKADKKKSEILAKNIRLVVWNPLFLLEIFGSGHNDSIMIFFTLLAYFFFNKKSFLFSGIVLACAVQVKLIPLLLFIFLFVSLLQKKNYKGGISFLVSFSLINAVSFWLMGVSPLTFAQRVSYNAGVYWQSLPNLMRYLHTNINVVFSISFLVIFGLLIIYQFRSKQNPLLLYVYSLAFYLFFFITAYWNWYALWILTLVPLLSNERFKFFILIFSFTSLLAYPFYWLSLRYNYQNILWPITIYLFVFIVPVAVYFLTKKKFLAKQIASIQ